MPCCRHFANIAATSSRRRSTARPKRHSSRRSAPTARSNTSRERLGGESSPVDDRVLISRRGLGTSPPVRRLTDPPPVRGSVVLVYQPGHGRFAVADPAALLAELTPQ